MKNLYAITALVFTLALLVGVARANPNLPDRYEIYNTGISSDMHSEPVDTGVVAYDAESHTVVN